MTVPGCNGARRQATEFETNINEVGEVVSHYYAKLDNFADEERTMDLVLPSATKGGKWSEAANLLPGTGKEFQEDFMELQRAAVDAPLYPGPVSEVEKFSIGTSALELKLCSLFLKKFQEDWEPGAGKGIQTDQRSLLDLIARIKGRSAEGNRVELTKQILDRLSNVARKSLRRADYLPTRESLVGLVNLAENGAIQGDYLQRWQMATKNRVKLWSQCLKLVSERLTAAEVAPVQAFELKSLEHDRFYQEGNPDILFVKLKEVFAAMPTGRPEKWSKADWELVNSRLIAFDQAVLHAKVGILEKF